MPRARLSHAEAMTLWAARDVYRITRTLRTLLVLFFVLEFTMEASHGYWYVGVVLVAVQYAVLKGLGWLLRWGLLWANRGVYWCLDHAQAALAAWWQAQRRKPV